MIIARELKDIAGYLVTEKDGESARNAVGRTERNNAPRRISSDVVHVAMSVEPRF